ncbi:unnamed protein product [Arctogadus glacialis]
MGIMTANQTGEGRFNSLLGKGFAEAVVILSTEKSDVTLFCKVLHCLKKVFGEMVSVVFGEMVFTEKVHVFVFIYFTFVYSGGLIEVRDFFGKHDLTNSLSKTKYTVLYCPRRL